MQFGCAGRDARISKEIAGERSAVPKTMSTRRGSFRALISTGRRRKAMRRTRESVRRDGSGTGYCMYSNAQIALAPPSQDERRPAPSTAPAAHRRPPARTGTPPRRVGAARRATAAASTRSSTPTTGLRTSGIRPRPGPQAATAPSPGARPNAPPASGLPAVGASPAAGPVRWPQAPARSRLPFPSLLHSETPSRMPHEVRCRFKLTVLRETDKAASESRPRVLDFGSRRVINLRVTWL